MFHCSVLLCKTGSQQALCQCIDTYGDLLFIQIYRDPTPMHCSTGSGQNACSTAQCCSAKQDPSRQFVSADTPMEICCTYRCAVTKHQCTAARFRAKCSPHCSVLLSKTGLQQACVTANTPMRVCSSYRCAVTQHQCKAALFRAKCKPH